jgi:protein-S-isoprenylcysteine O-methyltransferase Ste14
MRNKYSGLQEFFGVSLLFLFIFVLFGFLYFWHKRIDVLILQQEVLLPPFVKLCCYISLSWGFFLWIDSVFLLRVRGKGTPHPRFNPTQKIVYRGPYKYFRHPIYSGFLFIIFSRAMVVVSPFLFIVGLVVHFFIKKFIIPIEEKDNLKRFGIRYEEYIQSVDNVWYNQFSGGKYNIGIGFLIFVILLGMLNLFIVSPNIHAPIVRENNAIKIITISCGLFLSIVGLGLFISAITLFIFKVKGLKTYGPYSFVRNPMYSGFFHIYIGLSLFLNSWYCILFTPLLVGIASFYVAQIKERNQIQLYGNEFKEYIKNVPRFFRVWFSTKITDKLS